MRHLWCLIVGHVWQDIPNNHARVTIVNHRRGCGRCDRQEVKWSMFHEWERWPVHV